MSLSALFTWLALHPLAYFALSHKAHASAWRARAALTAYVLILASLPFQISLNAPFWRAAAATVAVSYAVKAFELALGRMPEAATRTSFPRFVLWLMVPHNPRWPTDPAKRALNRRRSKRHLARALIKLVATVALALVFHFTSITQWPLLVVPVLTAFHFYFFATAIADLFGAFSLFLGCDIDELFRFPFAARSPADFWSRRWNRYIARFGAQYIFAPLRKLGTLWASLVVFVASGVMHEYIVLAIFGIDKAQLGYMMAFFLLQWVGVAAQHLWLKFTRRKLHLRDSVAVALHLLWFVPTTPLFFAPVGAMLHSWGIVWRPLF